MVLALAMCVIVISSAVIMVFLLPREPSPSHSGEMVLKIGFLQKVDSINPMMGMTDASRFFYSLVYDSLFSVDSDLDPVIGE